MQTKLSIYLQVIVFAVSVLVLNPACAEQDAEYINALDDEAKTTRMKDGKPIPESILEPAVMPDESTDINTLTDKVTKGLQQALGVSNKGSGKKANVEDDLEKVISSALEQGSDMDDIRSAVNDAMAELKAQPEQTALEAEKLESASKALNQIVGENKDTATGNSEENYMRSLNESSVETPVLKNTGSKVGGNESNIIATRQEGSERTITVLKGESLYKIAKRIYGSGEHYMLLHKANRDVIINPDIILVGQILKAPDLP
jgi:nucleoid-associated protein YgaU